MAVSAVWEGITARKNATPYPVQVRAYVARLDQGQRRAFSAKDVYDELEHPTKHDFKASIGAINKALHQLWCEGALVAFVDEDGVLLREEGFVAPGSAAVEHPQVFAAAGTVPPRTGFRETSYTGHHSGVSSNGSPGPVASHEVGPVGAEFACDEVESPLDTVDVDGLLEKLKGRSLEEPAPEWLPDDLLRKWVALPAAIALFREGLDQASPDQRRQLILTGIKRKGEVRPGSAVATELVRLCRSHAIWWERCSRAVLYGEGMRQIASGDLPRLYNDLDGLAAEYDLDVIVLTSLRLNITDDGVRLLADEAANDITSNAVSFLEEERNKLLARVQLAHEDVHAARAEAREEKTLREAAERAHRATVAELERLRVQNRAAGDEASRTEDLETELDQLRGQLSQLESDLDSAHEEVEISRGLEEQRSELESSLARAQDDLAEVKAELDSAKAYFDRGQKAEQELQDALRTIGEQNVQIDALQREATKSPSPPDARSLVQLLDGAIGSLVADASGRIRSGDASVDDRQLLAFAAQFVEFKLGLPTVAVLDEIELTSPDVAAPEDHDEESLDIEEDDARETVGLVVSADEAQSEHETKHAVSPRRAHLGWTVKPIGGGGEIGASALLATTPGGRSVLLDAGQRVRDYDGSSSVDYDFHFGVSGIEQLSAVLISHAHIDHTGSLPVLHRNQSARQKAPIPVYMSEPTKELTEIMLRDSAKIQNWRERDLRELGESDLSKEMFSGRPAYGREEVDRVMAITQAATPYVDFEIPNAGITARFEPVAHVLGSCAIRLTDEESQATLLYTGDLGPLSDSQVTLPEFGGVEQITSADVIVVESTYGKPRDLDAVPEGRRAPSRLERERARLLNQAQVALERGGCVLLPSFSLGRAQELARVINQAQNRDLASARIYIGGMAEKIFEVYEKYAERGERDRAIRWVSSGLFPRTSSLHTRLAPGFDYPDVARELLASEEPCFVIASPGMLNGGWSRTFANQMVAEERHAVVLSGHVPTRLLKLRKGATYTLAGRGQTVACDWGHVGLSAHAQADDLRLFGQRLAEKSNEEVSFLCVHGLPESQERLAADLGELENVAEARSLLNNTSWTLRR